LHDDLLTFWDGDEAHFKQLYGPFVAMMLAFFETTKLEDVVAAKEPYGFEEEELYDIPPKDEFKVLAEFTDASTDCFSVGRMVFGITKAGQKQIWECNASPYLVWCKRA
jgi:hypothetical protein